VTTQSAVWNSGETSVMNLYREVTTVTRCCTICRKSKQ